MNDDVVQSICQTTADYRADEGLQPTPDRVKRWVRQFDEDVRDDLLAELDYVLDGTYIKKRSTLKFLKKVATSSNLTNASPGDFWKNVSLLDLQIRSKSQKHLNALLQRFLSKKFNVIPQINSDNYGEFVYLDDGIFSGNRILNDLRSWINGSAPDSANVNIVVLVSHSNGKEYAKGRLHKEVNNSGKGIKFKWWKYVALEDPYDFRKDSDVLRPRTLPDSPEVNNYVEYLNDQEFPPVLMRRASCGPSDFFSSEKNRDLLEEQFLRAGARLKAKHTFLPDVARPLGYSKLKTLGFGSIIVTYRNCPNNCPLSFWVEDDEYPPLFPRIPNQDRSIWDGKTSLSMKDIFGSN